MPSRSKLNPNAPEFHRLADLRQRLALWRQTPITGKRRIPSDLWQEAAALARAFSPHYVSHALGIEYVKLRRLVSTPSSQNETQEHCPSPDLSVAMTPRLQTCVGSDRSRLSAVSPSPVVAGFIEAIISPQEPARSADILAEVIRPQGEVLRVFSAAAGGDLVRAFLQA